MLLQIKPDTTIKFNPKDIHYNQTKREIKATIEAIDADDNIYLLTWTHLKSVTDPLDYQHPDKLRLKKHGPNSHRDITTCYLCDQLLDPETNCHNIYIPGRTRCPSQKNYRYLCDDCAQQLVDISTLSNLAPHITYQDWGFEFNTLPNDDNTYLLDAFLIDQCTSCHQIAPLGIFTDHICDTCLKQQQQEAQQNDQAQ